MAALRKQEDLYASPPPPSPSSPQRQRSRVPLKSFQVLSRERTEKGKNKSVIAVSILKIYCTNFNNIKSSLYQNVLLI